MTFIEKNVRVPVKVFGDLRAQLAACHIAERQFLELVERYGVETSLLYMDEVIDYAERMTRAGIRELPDGVYSFETGSTTTASISASPSGSSSP